MAILEINQKNFAKEVLNSDQKVLVDFNASWCGPCQMLKPIIEAVAAENNQVKIVSVNVDNEPELAEQYNVSSIPCLVLFNKGSEIKRNIGLVSQSAINDMIGDN